MSMKLSRRSRRKPAFIRGRIAASLLVLFCIAPGRVWGEQVAEVRPDGVIEFESGRKVVLAGIRLAPEAESLLQVLIQGKVVEVKYDKSFLRSNLNDPDPVYLYVETSEIQFPFKQNLRSEEKRVMVNQLLISFGAAQVDRALSFKYREKFEAAQKGARLRGEGIWSYDEKLG